MPDIENEYPIVISERGGIEILDCDQADKMIITEGGLRPIVDAVREMVANHIITDDKDRKALANDVKKVARDVEKYGKDIAAAYKARPKIIDGNRRFVADALGHLADAIMEPITIREKRIADIDALSSVPGRMTMATTSELRAEIERINGIDAATFGEFADSLNRQRESVVLQLSGLVAMAEQKERDAAELEERRRKEAAEQRAAEIEQARLEGERRAKERMEQEARNRAEQAEHNAVAEASRKSVAIAETVKEAVAEINSEADSIADIRAAMKQIKLGADVPTALYKAIKNGHIRGVRSV